MYMTLQENTEALLKHLSQLADRSNASGGESHPDLRAAINYAASIFAAVVGFELDIDDTGMIAAEGYVGYLRFLNKYGVRETA